jgi:VWFA-related protein
MCQRRFHIFYLNHKIFPLAFCLLILVPITLLAQQDTLKVTFNFVSISDTVVLGGKGAAFPHPVLSLITVRDQNNKYIHNLADTAEWLSPNDTALCKILVDSIWNRIYEYHKEDTTVPDTPDVKLQYPEYQIKEVYDVQRLSVALVMDYSKSIGDSIDIAEEAARRFIRRKKPKDEIAIIKFAWYDSLYQDFTTDTAKLMAAVAAPFPERWGTVIYDAIYSALELPLTINSRRAVVAYTDGTNNGSIYNRQEVIDLAQEKEIPVFTIGIGAHVWAPGLKQIADSTGGIYLSSTSIEGLTEIYLSIYGYIGGYYVMAHNTTDPSTDGTWRTVDLTCKYSTDYWNWIYGRGLGEYYVPYIPPDIALSKRVLSGSTFIQGADTLYYASKGDTVSYEIVITNIGDGTASDLEIIDMPADSLRPLDFEIQPDTTSSSMICWKVPFLGIGGSMHFRYRGTVDLLSLPWQDVPFINEAHVVCSDDTDLANNTDQATIWIGGVPPPPPQIRVSPALIEPGEKVQVDVKTPVATQKWDLIVFFENNTSDTTYADSCISVTELVPLPDDDWMSVVPDFAGTWMRTDKTEEQVGIILRTWGLWNGTMSDTAYFKVGSADEFWLDENIYRPQEKTYLGLRFKLGSNRRARITIYDIAGGFVTVAMDRDCAGGWNYDQWDGKDKNGRTMGSGVYIAILESGNYKQDRKFIIVR